jgi:chain length determinant protein tyrosine kinase EpsG
LLAIEACSQTFRGMNVKLMEHKLDIRGAEGGPSIGAILVDAGRLSLEKSEHILRLHRKGGKRFGDAAIELGLLTEDDIRFALANQFDYAFLPSSDKSLDAELVAAYAPFSQVVEQLRALRSQLMLRWVDGKARPSSLAVVSPGKAEGRSFLAANLAIVFSQLGARTLLIDADLRTPRQHVLFKLGNTSGLSELLAGRLSTDAIVRIPNLRGLSVLPAGAVPPNPQELLGRPAFVEVLRAFSSDFDVVIIDTPAATEYADAQTIAVRAGAALMVARKNKSSVQELSEFALSLRQAGTTLIGSVLNEV